MEEAKKKAEAEKGEQSFNPGFHSETKASLNVEWELDSDIQFGNVTRTCVYTNMTG